MRRIKHVTGRIREKLRFPGINRALMFFAGLLFFLFVLIEISRMGFLPLSVAEVLENALLIAAAYFFASLFLRLTVGRVANAIAELEVEQRILVSKSYTFLIYLIATVAVLYPLGLNATNITLIFGFVATGLAFALREIILSYFAWFMLLTKKPFRIGDNIRIGEDEGKVLHIGTFYVFLDDSPERSDDYVRVPNKLFLEKSILNFGRNRIVFTVRIPLPEPAKAIARLESIIRKLKQATGQDLEPLLDAEKERCFLTVEAEAKDYDERDRLRHEIVKAVLGAQ